MAYGGVALANGGDGQWLVANGGGGNPVVTCGRLGGVERLAMRGCGVAADRGVAQATDGAAGSRGAAFDDCIACGVQHMTFKATLGHMAACSNMQCCVILMHHTSFLHRFDALLWCTM